MTTQSSEKGINSQGADSREAPEQSLNSGVQISVSHGSVDKKPSQAKNNYFDSFFEEVGKTVVGQKDLILRILISILARGHVLIEGVPGIAKTLTAKTIAKVLGIDFKRIQFTPDLLPSDLLGTSIYDAKLGSFRVEKGPLFSHVVLADEINRAPPKVQSALLEVMAEQQISIFGSTYKLDNPFLVMATQNPIEQEGTYPLPEAECDRFFMKIVTSYPSKTEEEDVLARFFQHHDIEQSKELFNKDKITSLQKDVKEVYVDKKVIEYIVRLVAATRPESNIGSIGKWVQFGASPRASIAFMHAAQAYALISGRNYVAPQDVKIFAKDILRHRLVLTYDAEAEGIKPEDVVESLLSLVEVQP